VAQDTLAYLKKLKAIEVRNGKIVSYSGGLILYDVPYFSGRRVATGDVLKDMAEYVEQHKKKK